MIYEYKLLEGECFWGASTLDGVYNPYTENSDFTRDFRIWPRNQTMPFLVSNKGRYIWSETMFNFTIKDGVMTLESDDEITMTVAGTTLREAYMDAMKKHFPFDGVRLPDKFFTSAQYNTWMEFDYHQNQKGILEYAHAIVDNGYEPGILMIDEGWHKRYGEWEFDLYKFPDPKAMTDELHELGFKVLLWVTPYVSPDGYDYVKSISTASWWGDTTGNKDRFVRNAKGEVALFKWWNGYSAMLDFRKPNDFDYLDKKLKKLMDDYGIDGFKFDGANPSAAGGYHPRNMVNGPAREDHDPYAMNIAWNEFGRRYEYHEFKDTYKGGGKNGIQRLADRNHKWVGDGIDTIIPSTILQGLIGHPFICPDMIGGGSWAYNVMPDFKVDEELFVRMAQVSVFCPMMQFSWAPWRVLSEKSQKLVHAAAMLHKSVSAEILELVRESEVSGEPIVRSLEYNDPGKGYQLIVDQYMVGRDILVAPVITPETYVRDVVFPEGVWVDPENGKEYQGGMTHKVECPIEKLPWFRRKK
ncbi:MAG: alpha-galactosidase [Clostridia bacterium]|nr:alpha-galactosidase [Clostridia bacterium]